MKNVVQSVPFKGTIIVQLVQGGQWYLFLKDFVVSAKSIEDVHELGSTFLDKLQVLDSESYAVAIVEYLEDYPKPK